MKNKPNLGVITVKLKGKPITIDLSEELSINENLIDSQLRNSPSKYFIFAQLRDKYIRKRDDLSREKEEAYSKAWLFFKDSNDRLNNEYVSHKANTTPKYVSICKRYNKIVEKTNLFISICKAYESRENILRTISANLRKQS